jgi:DNA polymerase-3 subunit delta'
MSFKEIFCQDKAIATLQRAFLSGRWAHAYIFAGREGVGKFKTAHEWAKLLLCENPKWTNHELTRIDTNRRKNYESVKIRGNSCQKTNFAYSCGSCRSCQLLEAGSHPDFEHIYKELVEFTKEGKGRKTPVDLPIDVIREFLIEKVSTKPTLSQRKVFVVSEAEKLNSASQNALLKVLEEPPAYCCIILLCTRLERLLPTTKSRCQIIRFGPIDEDKIIKKLKEMGLTDEKAQYFARLSAGSLGTACQWAELELADANIYQNKKKLISSLACYEYVDALELAQKLLDDSKNIADAWSSLDKNTSKTDINRKTQKTFIQIIISALQDAMKLNVTLEQAEINFDQKEQIKMLASRFDAEETAEKISECYRMLRWIESGVNEKLIFEQLLLNLADSDIINVLQ